MENFFLALSDRTRLRLLNLMRENEICVNYLAKVLGESQPKISRHLAFLRNANIVSARREGKWMNYKIDFPENLHAANMMVSILEWLKSQEEMQNDYAQLLKLSALLPTVEPLPDIDAADKSDETYMKRNYKEELPVFLL